MIPAAVMTVVRVSIATAPVAHTPRQWLVIRSMRAKGPYGAKFPVRHIESAPMADGNDPPGKLTKPDTSLAPEIVEALKIEGNAQININILIQKVAEKAQTPEMALQHIDTAIELSRKYEDHRLDTFRARTRAIIDAKENDPDEIEKRLNNRTRRQLKGVIATCAVVGIAGALVSAAVGGGIVITGLLAAFAGVSIAMSGPLASGESISSTDVVRMVQALGDVIGKTAPPRSGHDGRQRR